MPNRYGASKQSSRVVDKTRIAELETALRRIVELSTPGRVCKNCKHCWNGSVIDFCDEGRGGSEHDPKTHSCEKFQSADFIITDICAIAQDALR